MYFYLPIIFFAVSLSINLHSNAQVADTKIDLFYPKHVSKLEFDENTDRKIKSYYPKHVRKSEFDEDTDTKINSYNPKHVRNSEINDNTDEKNPTFNPKHMRKSEFNDNSDKFESEHLVLRNENDRTDKFKTNFETRKSDNLNVVNNKTLARRKKHSESSSSTSDETLNWKDEWKLKWQNIKQIATSNNMSKVNKGDRVNMIAARPWGVPCGDPKQHDVPWGSCTLAMECEAEYRIYRGDYFCGRTEFVCCSILLNTYDMYHGFLDVELSDSSLETDSEELKVEKKSKGKDGKKSKKKRKRLRHKRKKAIKKLIKKTVKEIGKILNRTYKFGTKSKIRKTNQLKKFVKELKKKYKKDRQSVKDIHEIELHKIDSQLNRGIVFIREINRDLVYNNSIHRWIVNGTLSRHEAKVLRERYPNIWKELKVPKILSRRRNLDDSLTSDYDIEYGLLYEE